MFNETTDPARRVYCEDAIGWLQNHLFSEDCSLVSSLPDFSEFPSLSLLEWKKWFVDAATLIISKCPDEGVAIFFQSDIKHEGVWVDKGFLVEQAAQEAQSSLLWHKIVCRAPAGVSTFGRPSYSHLLCFSKSLRLKDLAATTADVISEAGEKTWTRGMGIETALVISRFIKKQTTSNVIVNPFCGEGSVLAAANFIGLSAIGIERSPKRAEKSRQQMVSENGKAWSL